MQLSRIVQGIFGKPDPLYKFKIIFGDNKPVKKTKEQIEADKAIATMQAKSKWFGMTGLFKPKVETQVPKDTSV